MAMSFVSSHRRKVTTYGKASRKPSFDPFADDASPPKKTFAGPQRSDNVSPLKKTLAFSPRSELRKAATPESSPRPKTTGKLVRPSPKKPTVDLYDVPSSDDESDPFKFTTTKPSRLTKPVPKLAQVKPEKPQKLETKHVVAPVKEDARKRKRDSGERELTDRGQRAKTPRTELPVQSTRVLKEVAIRSPPTARKQSPRPNATTQVKGAKNTNVAVRSPPRVIKKGLSAPSALTCMVSEPDTHADTPMADAPTPDVQLFSDTVEDFLPSTPPLAPLLSPGSISRSGTVTPRQKDLWKKLLNSSDPVDSQGSLPISKLDLSNGSVDKKMAILSRLASDIPRTQRSRLVDTLKRSAPISEESESESEEEVMELELSSEVVKCRPPKPVRTESGELSSQEANTFLKTSSKVTYARARSYLEEKNEDAAFDLLSEEFSQTTGFKPFQSQPQFDEELSDEDDSQNKQPRTVHDLRAAGARRRLFDGLDSLVDEVSAHGFNSIGAKRSTIIELATKLFNKDAVLCILDHGLERKLLENCNSIDDTIFTFAAAVVFNLVADGGARLDTLRNIYDSLCFKHILTLLDNACDITRLVRDVKMNMSKIAQSSVLDFKKLLLTSELWPTPPTILSPQLVALKALETVVRRMREAGSKEVVVDEILVSKLLTILEQHIPVAAGDTNAAIHSTVALSILESSSLVDPVYRKQASWSRQNLTAFADLIPILLMQSVPGTEEFQPLALRLCINVTNKNPRACEAFAQPTMIQTVLQSISERFDLLESGVEGDDRLIVMDRLILSHGALLNLAEFSSDARLAAIADNDTVLKALVSHFLYGQGRAQDADSLQAAEMNIPYGWLAVLLGNLCLAYEVRERVRAGMPQQSLKPLVTAVDEFAKLWQRMNMQEFEGEEGQQTVNELAERMSAVVRRLREVEG